MVMATETVCQQFSGGELTHEAGEATDYASAEATALHERLVAYVHAFAGGNEPRSGVWVEHSYARARGASHGPAAHVRVLLAPRPSAECGDVDVERLEPPPPALPADRSPERDLSDSEHEDDWEARVAALAPSAAHARLAEQALDALRRMRLERLAGPRGAAREAARAAARRLRLALAAAAAHPAHAQRPGAWLHATLHAYLPRTERRLWDELASELRRAAPRRDPLAGVAPARGGAGGPWLLWLGCGRARPDARWTRRLGALVHTRVLAGAEGAAAAPEAWCAARAGSVRAALADALAEAGERPVVLGGAGAGAALATALAGGAAGVRGLLLLAPPLLTAEGARDSPDDVLAELRLPMLLVAGTGAAQSWRGAAREATRARGGARRLLELRGADDALRLPPALRRRLPQHALDAAVAEECARWVIETAARAPDDCRASPARERARRREARSARGSRADDEEDYAHLPSAARPAPAGSEPVEEPAGRVVSRGSGATPLALLPPRRRAPSPPAPPAPPAPAPPAPAPPAPAPPALQVADIMRLPIVFADDEPAPAEPAASPVTVTSGSRGYTRVIVASRGVRPGAAVRPGRPVLLRRGLRLLSRPDPH